MKYLLEFWVLQVLTFNCIEIWPFFYSLAFRPFGSSAFLLQEVGNLFFEKGIEALTLLSHITFLFVFGYYFFRQKELLHRWVFSFAAAGTIALGYSKFYIVLFTRMHSDIVTDWIALGGATLLAIAAVFLWPFIYRLIAIPERGVLLEINNALQGELKPKQKKRTSAK